jgi:hypothetical protein
MTLDISFIFTFNLDGNQLSDVNIESMIVTVLFP